MKLSDVKPNVESSGLLEEQFFSIEDQGMIFDILRNKMYSNSILAICREISCNARDAHREVGKDEVPIEITLPTHLDPNYKIKDFGPGISPDRMLNVFIKYTASTKRTDNLQTGGFGLGAKTPFSYSDSFTIVTCVDGILYNYACFIDETKVGKLALLSETPANGTPNGTTIIIPVKPADFNGFRDCTEQATRYWKVAPVIKGGEIKSQRAIEIISGNGWFIANNNNYYHDLRIIVDGIEYPVDIEALKKYADCKLISSCRGSLYFHFGVGELSLSANREQIHLDKRTQEKISEKMNQVIGEISTLVETKINNFPNLWDANCFYRNELNETFSNIKFLGTLKWQGVELKEHHTFNVGCEVFNFNKNSYYRRRNSTPPANNELRLRRSRVQHLQFEPKSKLVINDLGIKEPTPRHVKKAFEDDADLISLQLICPTDQATVQALNDKHHLDKMGYVNLSDLTKATSKTSKKTPINRLLVFKLDRGQSNFRMSTHAAVESDTSKIKILCELKKDDYYHNNRMATLKSGKLINSEALNLILSKNPDTSIYGVDINTDPARIAEEFDGFVTIDTYIEEFFKSNTLDFAGIKYAVNMRYQLNDRILRHNSYLSSHVSYQGSPAFNYLQGLLKLKELLSDENQGMLTCYENLNKSITDREVESWINNHPDLNLDKIHTQFNKNYPLLGIINEYHIAAQVGAVAEYINLIDSKNNKTITTENNQNV